MINQSKLKIVLGLIYLAIVIAFLLLFFNYFSLKDFATYELLKSNRDTLNELKNSNFIFTSILFLLFCIIWCLLLGFASPIYLLGGFIFGKWIGSILVILGLSFGSTIRIARIFYVALFLHKKNLDTIEVKFFNYPSL